jgi:hypothetical protein
MKCRCSTRHGADASAVRTQPEGRGSQVMTGPNEGGRLALLRYDEGVFVHMLDGRQRPKEHRVAWLPPRFRPAADSAASSTQAPGPETAVGRKCWSLGPGGFPDRGCAPKTRRSFPEARPVAHTPPE